MSSRRERAVLRTVERFRRPTEGRLIGGVCAALSVRSGLDPLLLRLLFVLLALVHGAGLLLYLALWWLLPEQGEQLSRASLGAAFAGRASQSGRAFEQHVQRAKETLASLGASAGKSRPPGRLALGASASAVGGLVLLASFGWLNWITPARALGLFVLALGVGLISTAPGHRSER